MILSSIKHVEFPMFPSMYFVHRKLNDTGMAQMLVDFILNISLEIDNFCFANV